MLNSRVVSLRKLTLLNSQSLPYLPTLPITRTQGSLSNIISTTKSRLIKGYVTVVNRATSCLSAVLTVTFIALSSAAVSAASSAENTIELNEFSSDTEGLLFTLQGSNTIGAHLAPAWAMAYLKAKGCDYVHVRALENNNEVRVIGKRGYLSVYIDIHAHGSSTGFKGLHLKTADIALASRSIKPTEKAQLKHYGNMSSFNAEHVVAIDGLAVVVNPSNPIEQLTVEQVAQIFSGKIRNWREVGGLNHAINIYARDDNSGTWDTFSSLVLGKSHNLSASAARFESNDQLSDSVARDVAGIGFVGLASVRRSKALAIQEQDSTPLLPEPLYVATEDYALARRLYMYTPAYGNKPEVDEFIAFAHSITGQKIVEEIGFISQNPISLAVDTVDSPRIYSALTQHGKRLSINFRFVPGDANLDNKAKQDVQRVVDYINKNKDDSIQIQLVGFSKLKATESRAKVISKLRTAAVKAELFRQGIVTDAIIGLGADLPVAANEGRSALKNERVEIWLFDKKHKHLLKEPSNADRINELLSEAH